MKKKKNIIFLVLIILALVGIGIGGFFLIKGQMSEKVYKEKMEEGRKYLSRMKYEEAVAAFEFALEEKPDEEDPYISIYRTRIAQGELRLAQRILRQGYQATGSDRISGLLETCEAKIGESKGISKETGEIIQNVEELSQNVTINTAMLQKLEKYTYASYTKEFGKYISNEMSGESLEMVHSGIEAVFTYQNKGNQKEAINTARKLPNENAKPMSVRLANIGMLFKNFNGGLSFDRLSSIAGTVVECEYNEEIESYVDTFVYRDCKIEIACKENGDIVKPSAWNRITPPEGNEEDEKVIVEGVIINAVDGQGLDGVHLIFKEGESGRITEEVDTDSNGNYEAKLPEGTYEVEVIKDGFITDVFEVEVEAGQPVSGEQFPLSPELGAGEIRIVLTWNAYPTDLDAYIRGKTSTGNSVFISYRHKVEKIDGEIAAELDVDERAGFGPETITIYADGDYEFSVVDFTNTGDIGSSGAQVKVYMEGSSTPEIFNIPNEEGVLWEVFRIEDGRIIPVNEIPSSPNLSYATK